MVLRTFLSVMAPVAARQPAVFLEALRTTCSVAERSVAGSVVPGRRPMISLKKQADTKAGAAAEAEKKPAGEEPAAATAGAAPAAPAAGEHTSSPPLAQQQPAPAAAAADAQPQSPRGAPGTAGGGGAKAGAPGTAPGAKPAKKVPHNFLEVIDSLVDVLLRYNGPPADLLPPPSTTAPAAAGGAAAAMDTDAAPGAAAVAAAAGAAAAAPAAAPGASTERLHIIPHSDGSLELRTVGAPGAAASQSAAGDEDKVSREERRGGRMESVSGPRFDSCSSAASTDRLAGRSPLPHLPPRS